MTKFKKFWTNTKKRRNKTTKVYAKQVAPEYQESPLNIDGYSFYCTLWSDEGIRKEIANAEGVDPADVVLYAFDGWIRTEQYKEVV